ncbi:hypothetical protein F5884DRAFT_804213 [Xylogone sp. PMI_703]|nr:hypothetical protein F5884DRAFT_804213 [Xylogone sp. PMI_703]
MRFSLAVLSALIAGAVAGPLASSNDARGALDILEQRAAYCPCHPNCGCPSGSACFCQHGVPPIRPPCYPDCGCPSTSAVCVVSDLCSLTSVELSALGLIHDHRTDSLDRRFKCRTSDRLQVKHEDHASRSPKEHRRLETAKKRWITETSDCKIIIISSLRL